MKKRTRLAAGLLAAALVLTLAACGGPPGAEVPEETPVPTADAAPTATPEPTTDLVLAVFDREPQSLDPARAVLESEVTILSHVFEGLMKWGPSGRELEGGVEAAQVVPGMAQDYDRAEDETSGAVTYTFHLRDAQWTDKKPVTAHDFVYAWQRLMAAGGTRAQLLERISGARAILAGEAEASDLAVRAVDDTTLEVTLTEDTPWFLELCAQPWMAPVRQDGVEEGGSDWTGQPETYLTNGPYTMEPWDGGEELVLSRSQSYYDPAGPDSLHFLFETGASTLRAAFDQGGLDVVRGLEPAQGESPVCLPVPASYYLIFQTAAAPFDDGRVRQAFSLAIDRERLAADQGYTPAGALVPAGIWDADGAAGKDFRSRGSNALDLTAYEANCAKARTLLEQAGYPGGEGLPEVDYLYPGSDTHRAVAKALKEMWQEALGVEVVLKEQEWGAFLSSSHQGSFAMARGRWVADDHDPASFLELWRSGAQGNDGGYANAAFDQLLDRAEQARDPAQRMGFLHQAEKLLVEEDVALAPVYFETRTYLMAPELTGLLAVTGGQLVFTGCRK